MTESPIDTKPFMRDMGRGYPEFDYAAAWHEVRPMWDTLSETVRDLYVKTCEVAAEIGQDSKLDLPWPKTSDLREDFAAVPAEELSRAASIIDALGHWCPGDVSAEDRKLFGSAETVGGNWKFALYADQSIRAREGRPSRGREPRPPTDLETVCAELGIKAERTQGAPVSDLDEDGDDWRRTARGWTVKLVHQKRSITVPFWQGAAHTKPPTAADVLSCLVSDASSYESARDFEDWARDLGYDTDSIKAKRTYEACGRTAKRVRTLLGKDFERVASAEH